MAGLPTATLFSDMQPPLASRAWFDPDRPVNEEELLAKLEAQLAAKFSAAARQLCRPAAPAGRAESNTSSEEGGGQDEDDDDEEEEDEEEDEMDEEEDEEEDDEEEGNSEDEATEESDTVPEPQSP